MSTEELKGKRIDRATLHRAWAFAHPYRALLLAYLGVVAIVSLLSVLPPLVFRSLIDDAIPARDLAKVNVLAGLAVFMTVASSALNLVLRWMSSKVGEGIIADTRKALYDHVQRMPIAFFTRTQTGALMSRLNNDVIGAQQAFTFVLRTVFTDVLLVGFTVAFMIALSWQITVGALATVPFLLWITKRVGKLQEKTAREQMKLNAEMSTVMTERFNVAGALLVKLFGRPEAEAREFAGKADAVAAMGVKRTLAGSSLMLLLPMVGAVGTAAVYWWGARAVIDGSVKLGTVVAMATYIQRLWQPLVDLAGARIDFITAFVSFERIFEVLDAPVAIQARPNARALPAPVNLVGRIEFDHVSFRYPAAGEVSVASLETVNIGLSPNASAWVLRDISFTAEPGTVTALVGPSGAGKTTLASLIPRLYDATEGAVRIDGSDIREVTMASLRSAVGVVTQDAHLFHESIGANLRYARPDASDAELEAACRAAQIHDMIASLPDGYRTTVGERGYRLSGGEKQRIAIARVLLKNPRIVVLDEATAHLDSETESQIQQAFDTALSGRTAVVIAHRLSTIQTAHQILVIDNGQIVERGRHEDLVAQSGLYRELYETQYLRTAASTQP